MTTLAEQPATTGDAAVRRLQNYVNGQWVDSTRMNGGMYQIRPRVNAWLTYPTRPATMSIVPSRRRGPLFRRGVIGRHWSGRVIFSPSRT